MKTDMKLLTWKQIGIIFAIELLAFGALYFSSCQPVHTSTPPETVLSAKDSLILQVMQADTNYTDCYYNIGQSSPEQYREALTYKIQDVYGLPDSAKAAILISFIKDSL